MSRGSDRSLAAPLVAVGDGALGLWAAFDEVFPETRHQRCWNHRTLNVLDRLPKRLWAESRRKLAEVWSAPTRAACEVRRDELAFWFHERGQDQAAETLYRDWDDFTVFYDFPAEHWVHLRTSNPIESVFSGVRLRTNVAKRARVRENAPYLVFKIVERLSTNWRTLNGGANLMGLVVAGERFVDGQLDQTENGLIDVTRGKEFPRKLTRALDSPCGPLIRDIGTEERIHATHPETQSHPRRPDGGGGRRRVRLFGWCPADGPAGVPA